MFTRMATLAEKLIRLRMEQGLSQKKLAAVSGVHRSTINLIERGKQTAFTAKTRDKLARALGVHSEFFRRTWAYRNLKIGISPKFVQLVGGWSDPQVLDGYVRAMTSEDALGVRWV